MTPSDKNNVLHAVESQAEIFSDPHTAVDILDQPFPKVAMSDRILACCRERKG
jgi:hypothetical protein